MERKRKDAAVRAFSVVLVIVALVFAASVFIMPNLGGNVSIAKKHSLSNMKQQAFAHAMYVEAYDGFGPSPDRWMDQLMPYTKITEIFEAPFHAREDGEYGYAYYRPLSNIRVSDIGNQEEVVLAFESSDLRWNANGGFERLPTKSYHDDGSIVFSFLDTHVESLKNAPNFKIR